MAASKKKKSGLGKGLNELFQGEDIQTMIDAIEKKPSQFAQIQVPIDQIRPNPYQPRKHFDEEKLNLNVDMSVLENLLKKDGLVVDEMNKDQLKAFMEE